MPSDLYRDAHLGIRSRLTELKTRIRDREAEVTDAFWRSLDDRVRDRLTEGRAGLALIDEDSFDQLARAEAMLSSYLDEIDRLIARLPLLEAEWHELPDEVSDPPRQAPVGLFAPRTLFPPYGIWELYERFESTVRDRDREATIRHDGAGFVARFRDLDAPFAFRATVHAASQTTGELGLSLVTSVRRAMPRLCVRHETLVLSLGKALGLKREVEVGEPSFDGLFLIEGEADDVHRLLVPSVRAQLLALARFDIPTLEIMPDARMASLKWLFEPTQGALEAAIRVLASVRDWSPEVRFRRE